VRTIEIRVARVVFIAFRVFNSTRVIREEAKEGAEERVHLFFLPPVFSAEGEEKSADIFA
jgi:hypothetical protein|tara:strand:+ start:1105 stop:1284 length:180 start_codon:yes stop_codon:yes gene_type:complete